jgi:nucleoside-diphosphate-sugar epimerase
MINAIVTGSTGLVGRAVVKELVRDGMNVLCLGRRPLTRQEVLDAFESDCTYIDINVCQFERLPRELEIVGASIETGCVFFHFAWAGNHTLTDGNFESQLRNSIEAVSALKIARGLGCTKFINAGSMEETFIERFLIDGSSSFNTNQTNYGLAKLACRDICKIIGYLEKIDYIHTRLSVPIDIELVRGSYVASCLKKIRMGQEFTSPTDKRLFDFVSTCEVAKAYRLIGERGQNTRDYFIGSGRQTTLQHFFSLFANLIAGKKPADEDQLSLSDSDHFSMDALVSDIGFHPISFIESYSSAKLS